MPPAGSAIDLDREVDSVLRAAIDIASAEDDAYTTDGALRAECMRVRFEARARGECDAKVTAEAEA